MGFSKLMSPSGSPLQSFLSGYQYEWDPIVYEAEKLCDIPVHLTDQSIGGFPF